MEFPTCPRVAREKRQYAASRGTPGNFAPLTFVIRPIRTFVFSSVFMIYSLPFRNVAVNV